MSQYLSQWMSQQMRLEQRLTPQLIQSMTILQKPVAELEAYVNEALENNAALEVAEGDPERSSRDGDSPPDESRNSGNGRFDGDGKSSDDPSFARMIRWSRNLGMDEDDRPWRPRSRSTGGDGDAKLGALANTPNRGINLHDYLLDQWHMLELDPATRGVGVVIIHQLDVDGYLRVPLESVAQNVRSTVDTAVWKEALAKVQNLDPPGVGARDVVECLLLQIKTLPGDNTVERILVERHLDDLAHNRLPQIAKATGFNLGEITEALAVFRSRLTLHPGLQVGDRSVPPIRPDVIVEYADSGGGLIVRLARGNLPPLRIRDDVAEIARSRDVPKETREFARQHVDAATTLIDAVRFRQERLLQVSRAIVEQQREFFDVGPDGLKVFRMSDLAAELNCDPSTVSRTVSEKYMQAPRGIFPLRYFFTGGTQTQEGGSVGWDRVRARVRELIEAEDPRHPLSDDQVADRLSSEGLDFSRRTVAKYRMHLGIPVARQRRKF